MTNQTLHNPNLNGYAISEELFSWLEINLPKGKTILELGSGKGTIELCKNWKVFSVEDNPDWLHIAKQSNYIYAPLLNYPEGYKWYDIGYLKPNMPTSYDCLLIDAPTGKGRRGILEFMHLFPTWDVPIIIDDTHREEERVLATKLGGILNRCVFDYTGFEKSFSIIG